MTVCSPWPLYCMFALALIVRAGSTEDLTGKARKSTCSSKQQQDQKNSENRCVGEVILRPVQCVAETAITPAHRSWTEACGGHVNSCPQPRADTKQYCVETRWVLMRDNGHVTRLSSKNTVPANEAAHVRIHNKIDTAKYRRISDLVLTSRSAKTVQIAPR